MAKRTLGLIVVFLLACAPYVLKGQPGDTSSFSVLRLESSARTAALAGAVAAVPTQDVSAAFMNAGLLTQEMNGSLSASYVNHISDINAGFAAYARQIEGIGTAFGGIRFLSFGEFERADENGFRDGSTFGASDAVISLGLSRSYGERLRYGGLVHAVFSSIDEANATALAVDAGAMYYLEGAELGLSASLHNVGLVLNSFGETDDELPLDFRLGAAKKLRHLPLMISIMGYNLHDPDGSDGSFGDDLLSHLALGSELVLGSAFRIRLGYNHRRHEDLKTDSRLDLAGVGLGFGLVLARFHFDYAYNDWSALGGLHFLSVQSRI